MTAASLEMMLSFTPHYTPPGEYKEPPTVHVPRCPKQNIPRYGARGRGCQGEVGNRRGQGRVDHQLVDQDDVVADRKPDALAADMPSSSMPVIGPYYPVMNSDMPSSSMSAHEVPHYQTTTIVTPEGPFRQFASSEPLSFTDLSQRFTSDLPEFARHSSPTGRRLSFTDSSMACDVGASHLPTPDLGALKLEDATETQVVVAQCRSKKEHQATSCSTDDYKEDHSNLSSHLTATKLIPQIMVDAHINIETVRKKIKGLYQLTPSYRKAQKGRKKAFEMVYGDFESSFKALPQYMAALQFFNPGTVFKPSIDGFKNCRQVISIDDTHLYGKYEMKLLIIVGIDMNNNIFPLAYVVVARESFESWTWFLELLWIHVVYGRRGI